MYERLDPRCHLDSATGNGEVGSQYIFTVRAGLARARLHYVIREAIPAARWMAEVHRAGKHAGVQRAQLLPDSAGTPLRWTVDMPAGRLTRRLVTASCKRELNKWLTTVDYHARSIAGGTA